MLPITALICNIRNGLVIGNRLRIYENERGKRRNLLTFEAQLFISVSVNKCLKFAVK